jgi:hypothetical protein
MWELLALYFLNRMASRHARAGAHRDEPAGEQIFYRTQDGRADYAFSIERQSNRSYRVYISGYPSYGERSADGTATHRLTDRAGRHFICWSQPIAHLPQARQVAAAWAEATQRYIRTGRRF